MSTTYLTPEVIHIWLPSGKLVAIPVLLGLLAYLAVCTALAIVIPVPSRAWDATRTPAALNLVSEEIRFPARGGDVTLAGWFLPAENATRAVILVHGMGASRSTEFLGHFVNLAAYFQVEGIAVLMLDLRGHGQSGDGRISFGVNERRDVEGAVDWLLARGFRPGHIGALGISLGGASAIGAAAEDPAIGALIVDSGFDSLYPVLSREWYNRTGLPNAFIPGSLLVTRLVYGYDLSKVRPVDEIPRVAPRPVLIIQGRQDSFFPPSQARALFAAARPNAELWIVPGAVHAGSFIALPECYARKVLEFLRRNL